MWVEQRYPSEFKKGDRIAVKYNQNETLMEGKFLRIEDTSHGYMVYFTRTNAGPAVEGSVYSASQQRTFYRWEEDVKTEDTVHVVDESKLRLRGPGWDYDLINTSGVVAQQTTQCNVQVGRQTYVLKPGDHLRVWWEDGALWSELVQEVQK